MNHIFFWIFLRLPSKKGPAPDETIPSGKRVSHEVGEKAMMGKKTLGLIGAALAFLLVAGPLAAAEKTFQFDVPGCNS